MLDPRFQAAETEYRRLRAAYDAGQLGKDAFEAAVRGHMIEQDGRYWTLGPGSGRWFVSQGQAWVEALPPGFEGPPPGMPDAAPPAHEPQHAPSHPVPQAAPPVAPPRRSNGCLIGCLVTLGVVVALLIAIWIFLVPPVVAYVQMLKTQIEESSHTYVSPSDANPEGARYANGLPPADASALPPCPADDTPPAPALGQALQPTCDPSLPPGPPSAGP